MGNISKINDNLITRMKAKYKLDKCLCISNQYGNFDLLVVYMGITYWVAFDSCGDVELRQRIQTHNYKQKERYRLIKSAGENGCFKGSGSLQEALKYITSLDFTGADFKSVSIKTLKNAGGRY